MNSNIIKLILDEDWSAAKEQLVIKFIKDHPNSLSSRTEIRCRTPLMIASQQGNEELIKTMLLLNSDIVHDVDKRGDSPLMFASSEGHINVVKMLLNHGANVNHTNKFGETSLMFAAWDLHVDCVKELLLNGADKCILDLKGRSAVDLSLRFIDKGEIIDLLYI
jgi:ankyrin repeat protein